MKIIQGRRDEFDQLCAQWESFDEGRDVVALVKIFAELVEKYEEKRILGDNNILRYSWQYFLEKNQKKFTSVIIKKILYVLVGYWYYSERFVDLLPPMEKILLAEEYYETMNALQEASQKGFQS